MKKHYIILSAAAALAASSPMLHAQTAASKPVGVRTETVRNGFNLIGTNLAEAVISSGVIDVASATELTDNEASISSSGSLILKVLSAGPRLGQVYQVKAGSTATKIVPDTGIANFGSQAPLVGDKYDLRKMSTLATLFPAPSYGGLFSADEPGPADKIYASNGAGYDTYWLSNGDIEPAGWRRLSDNSDASSEPISYTEAFFLATNNAGATGKSITFTGHVIPEATVTTLRANSFNAVGRTLPITQATLSALSGLAAGDEATTSDRVFLPTGPGNYASYWLSDGSIETAGWKKESDNSNAATVSLTSGYFIQRRGASTSLTSSIPSGLDI
jgi:hypothetical protein